MNDKLFRFLLEQVAETKPLPDDPNTHSGIIKTTVEEKQWEQQFLAANGGVNPTKAVMVDKIKPINSTCEDCGQICKFGREIAHKIHYTYAKHWKTHCKTCDRWKNPYTGDFELTRNQSATVYRRWLKSKNNPDSDSELS